MKNKKLPAIIAIAAMAAIVIGMVAVYAHSKANVEDLLGPANTQQTTADKKDDAAKSDQGSTGKTAGEQTDGTAGAGGDGDLPAGSSGNASGSGSSSGSKPYVYEPDPNDYSDPEEFYEYNKDDFLDYEDAENYYYDYEDGED